MKTIVAVATTLVVVVTFVSGCISYSTLQTPDTLPPGKVAGGVGASFIHGGTMLEAGGRVGVARNFDIGLKYSIPRLFFADAKFCFTDHPLVVSGDLGVSTFANAWSENDNASGSTTGIYPMILVGQKHWYAGVKENYLSTSGSLDLFGRVNYSGSGWLGPSVLFGLWLGGDDVRLLAEVNMFFFRGMDTFVVPALGFQFRL